MKVRFDLELILYMNLLSLKEEKVKAYSEDEDQFKVYVFNDDEDFKNYFVENGYDSIDEELMDMCRLKTTKKGSVIALKGLCDHTISRYRKLSDRLKYHNGDIENHLVKKRG